MKMEDKINVDGDMRHYLNQLKKYWRHADDGHIIRQLLKDRIKRIEKALTLSL